MFSSAVMQISLPRLGTQLWLVPVQTLGHSSDDSATGRAASSLPVCIVDQPWFIAGCCGCSLSEPVDRRSACLLSSNKINNKKKHPILVLSVLDPWCKTQILIEKFQSKHLNASFCKQGLFALNLLTEHSANIFS